jgi:mannose-6-phosphate isomerase-like protein (cupin superfamily)
VKILRRQGAPRYVRSAGITSYLLASPRTGDASQLTTTLVEIEPGGEQRIHEHEPEQVYFILEGSGLMTVGAEREEVTAGDCILVPSGSPHGLRNTGDAVLRYFSAAAPSFTAEELARWWPLDGTK